MKKIEQPQAPDGREEVVPGTDIAKPEVVLTGHDGNAFAIMGAVSKALERAGVPKAVIDSYRRESMEGDYDRLLRIALKYADVS